MASTNKRFAQIDAAYGDKVHTMTEREKCFVGLPFNPGDKELTRARIRVRKLMHLYNTSSPGIGDPLETLDGDDDSGAVMNDYRKDILAKILPLDAIQRDKVAIEPPFQVDYGSTIILEGRFYANYGTVILDGAEVRIGDGVLFGPGYVHTQYTPRQ